MREASYRVRVQDSKHRNREIRGQKKIQSEFIEVLINCERMQLDVGKDTNTNGVNRGPECRSLRSPLTQVGIVSLGYQPTDIRQATKA